MIKTFMKACLWALGLIVIGLSLAFLILRTPDTDREAMIAKYSGAKAEFAKGVDGMQIHYQDRGQKTDLF